MGHLVEKTSPGEQCDERVLVVDDDDQIRHLIATVLDRAGIEAEIASDGEEALEKLRSEEFDLVLLDLMMPRVNGFEVIDCLESLPEPRTSIIVVSASPVSSEVDSECVKEIVDKPFDVRRLVDTVCRLLSCDHHRAFATT